MAALLAGEPTLGTVSDALRDAGAVVAWTRNPEVVAALAARTGRVLARDPFPPTTGPHASWWLARALEPLGVDVPRALGPLSFTRDERAEAARRLLALPRGFVAVHPGSGAPAKNWPRDRFVEAARRLAGGRPWLLVLGPAEAEAPAPPSALVAREWPLRILGAALASAGLFLGNDSGASHLAAAAGAPTLALFGPTDPALWSPVGPWARTLRARGGAMDDLDVDAVEAAARALTSGASGPPSG